MAGKITGKTKLGERIKGEEKISGGDSSVAKVRITGVKPKKAVGKNACYRLMDDDRARLKELVEAVDELEPNKRISETCIIKAAINYCTKIKPEKLLKSAREIGA